MLQQEEVQNNILTEEELTSPIKQNLIAYAENKRRKILITIRKDQPGMGMGTEFYGRIDG